MILYVYGISFVYEIKKNLKRGRSYTINVCEKRQTILQSFFLLVILHIIREVVMYYFFFVISCGFIYI